MMEKTRRREFTLHGKIAKSLQAADFFAKPYHSWERGTNEHTNGLVRQYFPKKTGFATITQGDVWRIKEPSTADHANASILKHPIRCSGRLDNYPRVVHLLLESAPYLKDKSSKFQLLLSSRSVGLGFQL